MIDVKELRRLAEAATPGPWGSDYCGDIFVWRTDEGDGAIATTRTYGDQQLSNAKFVAAANPATVIELLDERNAMLEALGPGGRYWFVERAKLIEVLKAARSEIKGFDDDNDLLEAVNSCADIKTEPT